jgi:nitroreductase
VRRYDTAQLDGATLARVQDIISGVLPLVPEHDCEILSRNVEAGEDLVKYLGVYGRLVNPPHYLAPYMVGERHMLEDLGYRAEQIAVRLATMGVGSCYIGALSREHEVRARFSLPEDARVAAFLVFGWPSDTLGGRAANRFLRAVAGATTRLPAERLFFQDTFDDPATPPTDIAPLIEAARNAPSAVNAQPWRFLWHGDQLWLFVTRNNRKYGSGPTEHYCFHDGGIAMANVTLAMEALGMEGGWELLTGIEPHIPKHPENLHPLATLAIERKRG